MTVSGERETRSRVLAAVLISMALAACKGDGARSDATPTASSAPVAATSAAALPEIPATKWGRCQNETQAIPYTMVFFAPEKGELFAGVSAGAMRYPLTVTTNGPNEVDFKFRSSTSSTALATESAGSVSLSDGGAWAVKLLAPFTCRPVSDSLFYRKLSDLGIRAGRWTGTTAGTFLTVETDVQRLIADDEKGSRAFFYRVVSKSDEGGIQLLFSLTPPNDARDEIWTASNVSLLGKRLVLTVDATKHGGAMTFERND